MLQPAKKEKRVVLFEVGLVSQVQSAKEKSVIMYEVSLRRINAKSVVLLYMR